MRQCIRIAAFLGLLLTFAFSVSCQNSIQEGADQYIMVASNINIPYWQEARAGLMDAASGMGVKAEFTGPTIYSPHEEVIAFREAVAKRPAGILVAPARPELMTTAIDSAIAAGIPVITFDTDAPDSKRILYIGTDNREAGIESGNEIAHLMKGKGRLVVITVPTQLNLEERLRGVQEALANFKDMKIVDTLDDEVDSHTADEALSALLKKGETIDGVVCLDASGGPGAGEALRSLGRSGKVPVVAMDTNPETLDFIGQGVISATIGQKPYTMAFYGLRFLYDLHHGAVHKFANWRTAPASPLPAHVDTGTNVINPENLTEFRAAVVRTSM
ncbi:MAG: substrate-binding domain-containing protein [Terriglobia bacterium]